MRTEITGTARARAPSMRRRAAAMIAARSGLASAMPTRIRPSGWTVSFW
jgi:hypothetical protein